MANTQGMAEHHAAITVNAPVHQVYGLFTHFNDFPKFMSFVKEVTYYDQQRSHWVAEVVGRHEWDAVNESWVEDRQIGWHSTDGLENTGRVTFQPAGTNSTRVDVYINYNPPAGVLGDAGENLGAGSRFDAVLQHDMDNFARMVASAPPEALDPTSSNYLFHSGSAAAKGTTTSRQDETMNRDNQGYSPSGNPMNAGTSGSNYASGPGYTNATTSNMPDPNYASGPTYPNTVMTSDTTGYSPNSAYPSMPDRPTLDQDIINEDTRPLPQNMGTQGRVMPNEGGVRNPVMPQGDAVSNPVMPSTSGATNPVTPNEGTIRNPIMPDESGVTNPVLPPEQRTTP